jgi:spore photoproduct lyase
LKLTYRAVQPYITVYANHDRIIKNLEKRISRTDEPIIFNSGELADSLSLEHLTGAAREFIPWFGTSRNGFLFMLTKCDNVDDILDLPHNGHTIIAWSMNNELVSRRFEIGAPPFHRRLAAARKVQEAGYLLRLRLDPVVPYNGWREGYADTIKLIFEQVEPERITIGTLRFEAGFYKMRNSIFNTGPELSRYLDEMEPMFEPRVIEGRKTPMIGKYSFTEDKRTEIFDFVIKEIRKYSDCKIALCKESDAVWHRLGLNSVNCECACQM